MQELKVAGYEFGQGGNGEIQSGGGGGLYGGRSGNSENGFYSGSGSGGSGYIGNPLLTDKGMYGYNVTETNEESTKTISTTNISTLPVENYAKAGNGYARIQYLSYSYVADIKVNGNSITGFDPETLEYYVAVPKSVTEVAFDVKKGADYQTITTSTDFNLTEKVNKK